MIHWINIYLSNFIIFVCFCP